MHYIDESTYRLAKEFKECVLQSIHDHKITRQMIADAIGVDPATVSRWFSYGGDLHFPAYLSSILNSKELRPLALDIIRFQAQRLGLHVQDVAWIDADLNGSLDDELLEIAKIEGKMVELKDKNPRQVSRLLNEMDRIAQRMRLELKGK